MGRGEVIVNGADDVFVERKGRMERLDGLVFEGEGQVFHLIERIVAPLGLRVDESMPYVDARLLDGSRSRQFSESQITKPAPAKADPQPKQQPTVRDVLDAIGEAAKAYLSATKSKRREFAHALRKACNRLYSVERAAE